LPGTSCSRARRPGAKPGNGRCGWESYDLNTLVQKNAPLYLLETGDINDRGEITGVACVVEAGVCGSVRAGLGDHAGRRAHSELAHEVGTLPCALALARIAPEPVPGWRNW